MARKPSVAHDPDYVFVITRLKEARLEAGLKQVAVGKALGKPHSFISKVEQGERRLDVVELHRLAQIYGKPYEFFIPPKLLRRKPSDSEQPDAASPSPEEDTTPS